ncbi:predicted protein [Arabidopsis lyrata subsp. lyrata]|uniref:Predicted protein n=1 Tax=Arabidopsis lyrata subsp. lyrata TaxID=81972 RepID=D7MIV8_ARALL|nr:predicted protein [Arabidopsis lyrata subsp. lyrata]
MESSRSTTERAQRGPNVKQRRLLLKWNMLSCCHVAFVGLSAFVPIFLTPQLGKAPHASNHIKLSVTITPSK